MLKVAKFFDENGIDIAKMVSEAVWFDGGSIKAFEVVGKPFGMVGRFGLLGALDMVKGEVEEVLRTKEWVQYDWWFSEDGTFDDKRLGVATFKADGTLMLEW